MRERSHSYPGLDLEEATELALLGVSRIGQKVAERGAAIKALGFRSENGAALRAVAALVHFGFLELAETGRYRTTLLGHQLVGSPPSGDERPKILRKAVRKPELFRSLFDLFEPTGKLPIDFEPALRALGIAPNAIEGAFEVFYHSAVFAGIMTQGGQFIDHTNSDHHQISPSAPNFQKVVQTFYLPGRGEALLELALSEGITASQFDSLEEQTHRWISETLRTYLDLDRRQATISPFRRMHSKGRPESSAQ